MKNQGGEAKAAPRPVGSSVAGGALLLEEGDTAEPTAALEGGEGTQGRGRGCTPCLQPAARAGGAGEPQGRGPGLEAAGLLLLVVRAGCCAHPLVLG